MKTLVIHPADSSTDFLKDVYRGLSHTTVITGGCTQEYLHNQIVNHDRIMMLGHGTPNGLLNMRNFDLKGDHIIDETTVPFLKAKYNICIWCYADEFVTKHELTGFYTGMFISEVEEANLHGIDASQDEIDYSNNLFAKTVNKYIDDEEILIRVREHYTPKQDQVIAFNTARLYKKKTR